MLIEIINITESLVMYLIVFNITEFKAINSIPLKKISCKLKRIIEIGIRYQRY